MMRGLRMMLQSKLCVRGDTGLAAPNARLLLTSSNICPTHSGQLYVAKKQATLGQRKKTSDQSTHSDTLSRITMADK